MTADSSSPSAPVTRSRVRLSQATPEKATPESTSLVTPLKVPPSTRKSKRAQKSPLQQPEAVSSSSSELVISKPEVSNPFQSTKKSAPPTTRKGRRSQKDVPDEVTPSNETIPSTPEPQSSPLIAVPPAQEAASTQSLVGPSTRKGTRSQKRAPAAEVVSNVESSPQPVPKLSFTQSSPHSPAELSLTSTQSFQPLSIQPSPARASSPTQPSSPFSSIQSSAQSTSQPSLTQGSQSSSQLSSSSASTQSVLSSSSKLSSTTSCSPLLSPSQPSPSSTKENGVTSSLKSFHLSNPVRSTSGQESLEKPGKPADSQSSSALQLLQSGPVSEALEGEWEHEDLDALAAAVSDNLQARLNAPVAQADDSIRAIFEHTQKPKRSESYGAFVVTNGVVQLGPLPEGHDSHNVISTIAKNNKVMTTSEALVQPKIYAMPTTRAVTTGANWFNMKSPELTPELKTDLAIIANRAYLDPKRFYKKEGTKKLPVHFQIGTVVAGAHEFYSSLSHKERSKSYVEEIYKDNTTKSYLKRKYGQIQAAKSMKGHTKKRFGKKRGK